MTEHDLDAYHLRLADHEAENEMTFHVLNWISLKNNPTPPPPSAPERDPEWCHSHGCHSSQCPN